MFRAPRSTPHGQRARCGLLYGSVEELEVNRVVCAGKRLHESLLEHGNAGVVDIAHKYYLEYQITWRTSVSIGG